MEKDYKVVELKFGSWELQHERHFLVEATLTAEDIRQKYNKCVEALKKDKSEKLFRDSEDFIIEYLESEYGWKYIVSDFVIHDKEERYGKIQDKDFNKVYLEEK
ncbi:hypothetical protein CVD28_03575 [Bacillus sp. M6-12]|uniref:hypothetical protein n=1 Tax=Bacillus sp. M6-12 TaxID=2054166 RepID=UPI000C75E636|nr:hypothetical protein [Bacillus sp. M6-12]PLS19508.1 hypothetical protein CVD28_03575 [Bacillus sp. M6-12]